MSPVMAGLGGTIEKIYHCDMCGNKKTTQESFVCLNFKVLSKEDILFIRDQFQQKGYNEGLIYKEKRSITPQRLLKKLIGRNQEPEPILTIRDYICHLNYMIEDKS